MATSSITKEFYVKDQAAFERLKKELSEGSVPRENATESPSLEEGRKKLAHFHFDYTEWRRVHLNPAGEDVRALSKSAQDYSKGI